METIDCEMCGGTSNRALFSQYDLAHHVTDELFTVVRCEACRLLFLNPRPTREEIGRYYPATYYPAAGPPAPGDLRRAAKRWSGKVRRWIAQDFYGYPAPESARGWQWLRRSLLWPEFLWRRWRGRGFLPWVGQGRALDVGCGAGNNLVALQELGWDVSGVDASEVAVAQARARFGERVRLGDLASMHYPDRTFDTVLFSHVLEHLHGPVSLLKEVWRILDWDGRVVILCPNAGGLEAKLFGRWWFPWELPATSSIMKRRRLRGCSRRPGSGSNRPGPVSAPSTSWPAWIACGSSDGVPRSPVAGSSKRSWSGPSAFAWGTWAAGPS